ncbi:MAG: PqqD family protein [Candidatus Aminicenantes bacterium]|nr:PqqD family protein [Candidatus Aminicenantes bacterium]
MRQFHIPWREIEKKAVIVSIKDNEVIVLNEVGTEIWKFLNNERKLDQIIEHVLSMFEADRSTVKRDVEEFLEKMQQRELLNVNE